MAQYTYLATDLVTGQVLDELPLQDVSIQYVLNTPERISGTVPLTTDNATRMAAATLEDRTAVYVDRDGVLVAGGILWKRRYSTKGRGYELQISGFASALSRRSNMSVGVLRYVATDQLTIARDLVTRAQAQVGGALGITVGTGTCGVLRDLTVDPADGRFYGDVLGELASLDNGFDWAVTVGYDSNGAPAKTLQLAYPRFGLLAGAVAEVLEYPGNVTEYTDEGDGERAATTAWGRATLENNAAVVLSASRPSMISNGYPALELIRSYDGLRTSADLQAHVNADLAAAAGPVHTITCTINTSTPPYPGQFTIGDDMRLRITDPLRYPAGPGGTPGLDRIMRCIGATLKPGTGPAVETLTMTFGEVLDAS
jgi:hypothetical protein